MNLARLLRPGSVAVIGGGAWCRSVLDQLAAAGFPGKVWHVHPRDGDIARIEDLPDGPDAAFVGINRDGAIAAIQSLSRRNSGGAVCFASGFAESDDGATRQDALIRAAGDMPVLGPNCYGLINAFDGAMLWPDQHGCVRVERGVAILTQSSNIALNLTMQRRGLPIGYVITAGNQAQTSQARIAAGLLDDPRVTAIGLHVEGMGDLKDWQALAAKAQARGVPIVALKVGKSDAAKQAAVSHTASLAGHDAGAQALLDRLGIARVRDLPSFLETLKLLHCGGPLSGNRIASISCSGGEASLVADMAHDVGLVFPPLTQSQRSNLAAALGPRVALANPLDYHTYVWRDVAAMTDAFSAMIEPHLDLTMLIVDFPRDDLCDAGDWECVITAAIDTARRTGRRIAMVATLPELMPQDVAERLLLAGIVPMNGLAEALAAIIAAQPRPADLSDLLLPGPHRAAVTLSEAEAKAALAAHGLAVPNAVRTDRHGLAEAAARLNAPLVLKADGLAHKTEAGGVRLNLTHDALPRAAQAMPADTFLVEEMVTGTVAELLIGVLRDPPHGFVLTLGAGGILTELLDDTVSVLLPVDRNTCAQALSGLKMAPVLDGYRGAPGADLDAVLDAIAAVQAYVIAHADSLEEVEINPLLCTPDRAVAADALTRIAK
ncbi:MAG: Acyl-CoA synthetase (NDP forming) [Rhodobacteraceae bacterium HLUCCA08]|nr:MAG: Acyl-CoA synthetase (NDP forming) [Rhodobacteraceae bacterium HLUCCA08]